MSDRTSKTVLEQLEVWIASEKGRKFVCTRQYPHPGYAGDHYPDCEGCLIVAAALKLKRAPVETTDNSEVELLRAALLQCYSYYPDGPLHRGWIYELVPNDEAACERAEKIMRAKSPGEPRETPAPQNMHSDEWWQAELDRCVGVEQDKYRALFATLRPPSSPEEPTAVCKRCNDLRFVVSTGQIGVPCPECNAENGTGDDNA